MATDYYKVLQVSNTVSTSEIEEAYHQLISKWQSLRAQQSPEAKLRSDKIIALIEEAYQVLSVEKTRAIYDRQLKQATATSPIINHKEQEVKQEQEIKPVVTHKEPKPKVEKETQTVKKPASRSFFIIFILLIIVAMAIYYVLFIPNNLLSSQSDTNALESTPITTPKPSPSPKTAPVIEKKSPTVEQDKQRITPPKEAIALPQRQDTVNNTVKVPPSDNTVSSASSEPEVMDANRLKNANNPELKETAERLAEITNAHKGVVLNFNTQFIEAKAANQNVTLRFMVIDGITSSKMIFESYLTERFVYDNQICDIQKDNIAKGTLFTFSYYNTQNELLGKYYIDQQVCESPKEKRLIKIPDDYQLNSIEIDQNGNPIPSSQEGSKRINTTLQP